MFYYSCAAHGEQRDDGGEHTERHKHTHTNASVRAGQGNVEKTENTQRERERADSRGDHFRVICMDARAARRYVIVCSVCELHPVCLFHFHFRRANTRDDMVYASNGNCTEFYNYVFEPSPEFL